MCDDFENELGSPSENVLGEDFSDIARHNIVDVLGMIIEYLKEIFWKFLLFLEMIELN